MKFLFSLMVMFLSCSVFAKNPVVVFDTSMGAFEIELEETKAPNTVKNFLSYVDSKFYDGTIFHRVINNFMVQGGGFDAKMNEKKTNKPIQNEASNGLKNSVGTVAMARTGDPHSATSQFFINVAENDYLNFKEASGNGYGYAVFGKVTSGMHVVNRIKAVKTGTIGLHSNVPMDTVLIKTARRKK